MKAILRAKYGSPDVLRFEEVAKPTPSDHELLIKVHAASANPLDWHMMRGEPFLMRLTGIGVRKPKNPSFGADMAGQVEAVGKDVKRFQPGDEVFGDIYRYGYGAFSEYVCVADDATIVLKPAGSSFETAAAVPVAALTALQGLRDKGQIQAGQKVLINGASGGVGTYAVQIAKYFGAEVTAVCSTRNVDQARSLGADHVIDYTKEDFTRNDQHYDLILAANGYHSIFAYKRALSPKGIYVCSGGTMKQMFQTMIVGPWLSMFGSKKLGMVSTKANVEDLTSLSDLLATGKVISVIDKRYLLSETAEAIRYLEEGHAQGKVVITM